MKGTKSVTEFMLEIKCTIDELALHGVSTDPEDLALKILNGLDDSFKELSHAIQAPDSGITFDELHEKLLSMEAQLGSPPATLSGQPTTAFYAAHPCSRPSPQPGRVAGPNP